VTAEIGEQKPVAALQWLCHWGLTGPAQDAPMLTPALPQPATSDHHHRRRDRRRHAVVLPLSRPRPAAPTAADWMAAYPCTRMHGAAFGSEFYPSHDEQF